jgi:hypothetical protein
VPLPRQEFSTTSRAYTQVFTNFSLLGGSNNTPEIQKSQMRVNKAYFISYVKCLPTDLKEYRNIQILYLHKRGKWWVFFYLRVPSASKY